MIRISILIVTGVLLAGAAAAVAQTSTGTGTGGGPATGTSQGAMSPQGLPPSTPRDLTGRSPGQLREQATTPGAPDVIPPANSTATELDSGGTLNRTPGSVGRSGG